MDVETIKIVMIGTFSEEGGIKNHILHLSSQLVEMHEHEIHIISLSNKDAFFEENKLKVHFIKSKQTLYFNLFVGPSLIIKKLFEISPELIHVHGAYLPYAKVVTDLRKKETPPVLLTVHGSIRKELEAKYKSTAKLYKYIKLVIQLYYEKKSIASADKVIAVSRSIKESIKCFVHNNSIIHIIPNGINTEMIDRASEQQNIPTPSIIFVGRLVKIKGCDVAIEAIKIVKRKYPTIKLYIVGEGDQFKSLEQLTTRLELENNITFLGFLASERFSYMKCVDICIVPSKYEAFGIVVLEAMACKKPVIASEIGGMKDIINNKSGCMFKVGDPNDLANKILVLLKNKDLSVEIGLNGRKKVENEYRWEKIARLTFDLYLN